MSQPPVSIIVPIYKRREYLAEALNSCLAQTFGDFEILVTEEAESDVAQGVLNGFRDPRIRYRKQAVREGVGANLQNAWRETTTPLLVILNDDDRLHPEFLQAIVPNVLANPHVSAGFCDINIIDAAGVVDVAASDEASRTWLRSTLSAGVHQPYVEPGAITSFIPIAMGTVFRREVTRDFRIEAGPSYDFFLSYLATRDGQAVFYEPRRLSYWRRHPNQESANGRERIAEANRFIYQTMLDDPRMAQWQAFLRERLAFTHRSRGLIRLMKGDRDGARQDFSSSLRFRGHPKACLGATLARLPAPLGARVARFIDRSRK
ncbi:MAG: glycosyltransferase family 2 protein [Tepidisphaeraceae bacterium]